MYQTQKTVWIRKIDTLGIITTIAGTVGIYGYAGDGGLATNATFNRPGRMSIDKMMVFILVITITVSEKSQVQGYNNNCGTGVKCAFRRWRISNRCRHI